MRNSGFTLVEIIIYIALFGLIASTLMTLAVSSAAEDSRVLTDVIHAYENP